jgi:hypothetical protein
LSFTTRGLASGEGRLGAIGSDLLFPNHIVAAYLVLRGPGPRMSGSIRLTRKKLFTELFTKFTDPGNRTVKFPVYRHFVLVDFEFVINSSRNCRVTEPA